MKRALQLIRQHRVIAWIVAVVCVALIGAIAIAIKTELSLPKGASPTNFEECAALYPVKGAFPQTCSVPFGKTFVEYEGNVPQVNDAVRLPTLPPAPVIQSSPFTFSGEAERSWFAGTGLTAELVAGTGEVIGTASATAAPAGTPADEGFEAFTVSISFTHPAAGTEGALVLKGGSSTSTLVIPVAY